MSEISMLLRLTTVMVSMLVYASVPSLEGNILKCVLIACQVAKPSSVSCDFRKD